ncbi:MAG: alpha/beta hydrolase [Candidatus Abyssobacteria bacterium SURF_5]|uniref:Alpha/beta hydrolase n=1 Tax=Abyssobacteria bacterium (strain SURF_5) TaxID=2093360 RepID=A0A3A4P977_ABYX5|nr:MAG: alpha/beta hydrolase [Candidatus Abyssubacteria bacterium SURF_5]
MKKTLKLILKYFIAPLLSLCVIVLCSLLLYRAFLQHKVREETRIQTPNGIDSLEEVVLGGVKQWILIRGMDTANPVLLHLHGGPGSADICIARHFDGELPRHFIVAHWDQRGAGKSYSRRIPVDSMNRTQFVSDVRELSEMLRERFHVPKIYLVGHSWGSEIGVLTAARHPELFYAFVGVGQVVEKGEQEEISYRFVMDMARKSADENALKELEGIGPPPYDSHSELGIQRKWLDRFGGVSHNKSLTFANFVKIGLTSPDYSLLDGLRFFRGGEFSAKSMWAERINCNLFEEAPRIEVPVYFFVGRYDYNTPFELAERYYQQLDAPQGKQLVWFENSGHMIPYEEPEKYCAELLRVLKETTPKSDS